MLFRSDHFVEGEPHRYAVVGRFEAMGRDGIAVGRRIGMVHEAADRAITRIESYGTWDEAFDAAGVAPADRGTSRR